MGVLRLNGKAYGGGIDVIEVTQAQYNALPESKLSDDILYVISDSVNGSDGYPPLIFSTEEREVGVWINGKPLYQRTISYISSTSAGVHNIETLTNVDNIVSMQGIGIYQTQKIPIPYYGGNNDFYLLWTDGANLQEYRGSANGFSGTQMYVTIQYTKATDTKGSGRWTTQGTLAQHYSTTESNSSGIYKGQNMGIIQNIR